MSWANDGHGLVTKATEVKMFLPSHTWGMKLSQLYKQRGHVRILTYSLPDVAYVHEQFDRRPYDISIVCHSKFLARAEAIKREFPRIAVAVHDRLHAKMLLIEPATAYVGSANFGSSGWLEVCVGLRSRDAHNWYAAYFDKAFGGARQVALQPCAVSS